MNLLLMNCETKQGPETAPSPLSLPLSPWLSGGLVFVSPTQCLGAEHSPGAPTDLLHVCNPPHGVRSAKRRATCKAAIVKCYKEIKKKEWQDPFFLSLVREHTDRHTHTHTYTHTNTYAAFTLHHSVWPISLTLHGGALEMHCGSVRSVGSVARVKKLRHFHLFRQTTDPSDNQNVLCKLYANKPMSNEIPFVIQPGKTHGYVEKPTPSVIHRRTCAV